MADGAQTLPTRPYFVAMTASEYSQAERELATSEVIAELQRGVSLNEICSRDSMPSDRAVRTWAQDDLQLAAAVASARERGFDQIALDTLAIADGLKPVIDEQGNVIASDVRRDDLRVKTRMTLLAKWDPKRYGEAIQMRHADADGEKLDTTSMVRELLGLVRPGDGAVVIEGTATTKEPPSE